ncbi:MAG: hypothetical protein JWR68_1005 [Polaromonas sp.]|nr:hypothetical protein [Polaromonas sp.]
MNRCAPHLFTLFLVLAATAPLASLPARAQPSAEFKPAVRQFPAAALRGEIVVQTPPGILLDGKADRLSPGARIRDANNLLVMSGALANQKVVVNYLRESGGNVHEVWILNSEEVKQKRPNTKASWFSFGSSADADTPASVKAP